MPDTCSTKDKIARCIRKHGSASSGELSKHLGISRQAINTHIRTLLDSGDIVKAGSTRNARYYAPSAAPASASFSRTVSLSGLDEGRVYSHLSSMLNLRHLLRANVESIAHYAFTEILNNAIDHSMAKNCRITAVLSPGKLMFEIREAGIGVFRSIADKLNLEDEQAAMIELIKGKTTTMPEAHSGEGIFFTSKAADRMCIRSHKIQIEWNRRLEDVFVSTPHSRRGTTVEFEISRDSRTRLEEIFAEYAPVEYDYQFQKTKIQVKLLQSEYISRSEAKRLVHNLNKFAEVDLDFRSVKQLGQGFADEVFRVFAGENPHVTVRAINASRNIDAMIRHTRGTAAH